ncbi:MAG TPA: hypothetical protein VG986_17875, partial [Pseudolabrys sp.]|nr:hypothetical protein [Pseudolabrys sp.]
RGQGREGNDLAEVLERLQQAAQVGRLKAPRVRAGKPIDGLFDGNAPTSTAPRASARLSGLADALCRHPEPGRRGLAASR